jgi:hypothetical protein
MPHDHDHVDRAGGDATIGDPCIEGELVQLSICRQRCHGRRYYARQRFRKRRYHARQRFRKRRYHAQDKIEKVSRIVGREIVSRLLGREDIAHKDRKI